MHLTAKELAQLRTMIAFRASPPTVGWYVKRAWKAYAWLALVGGASVAFFSWGGWPHVSTFFAGLVSATVIRDLRWFRVLAKNWPVSEAITNWQRVDELLATSSATAP